MGPAMRTYFGFDLFVARFFTWIQLFVRAAFGYLCSVKCGKNKIGNKKNIEWPPKKKTLPRQKKENKTESRRANECHSNRSRERKRESINYLVKVT